GRGAWFRLLQGALLFLSGGGPMPSEFEAADYVIGGSLGTEYELRLEGEALVISLYDGEVQFTNTLVQPDGSITSLVTNISSGQQAVVTRDRPPEIRPLLITR